MCRAKFDARSRHQGETIANYVAASRHLSEYCEFGDTLNDRLCEKFVTGVNNQDIQRKLLLERNLTLDKAIQLATSIQQSSDAAKSLTPPTINAIERTQKRKFNFKPAAKSSASTSTTRCHRCNGPHTPQRCKFKSATCYKCKSKAILLKPACQRLHLNSRLLASPGLPIISDNTMLIFTTAFLMTKVRRNPVPEQSSTSFPCLHLHIPLSTYPF